MQGVDLKERFSIFFTDSNKLLLLVTDSYGQLLTVTDSNKGQQDGSEVHRHQPPMRLKQDAADLCQLQLPVLSETTQNETPDHVERV